MCLVPHPEGTPWIDKPVLPGVLVDKILMDVSLPEEFF